MMLSVVQHDRSSDHLLWKLESLLQHRIHCDPHESGEDRVYAYLSSYLLVGNREVVSDIIL